MRRRLWSVAVLAGCLALPALGRDEAVQRLLKPITSVGKEGSGNVEAGRAWKELIKQGPKALLPSLSAFRDGDATAKNWLRSAVDVIAERELAAGRTLPVNQLEDFVKEKSHDPQARRLAYEWLVRVDKAAPNRLLPGMLQDPSAELRRDAVARVLDEAKKSLDGGDKEKAQDAYVKALAGATDQDQVDLIAKQLKGLGREVHLPTHFGFVTKWKLVGPFDNVKGVGFNAVYSPEKGVDSTASYEGKEAKSIAWKDHVTADAYGIVDLNKALGKQKGAVAYAFAEVQSATEQLVELRAGSYNAVRIFLNGKEVFAREEYHHGMKMDQHVGRGKLRPGRNEVLIKVCQNEQTEEWAQEWSFQLRLCDAVGSAVQVTLK